MARDPGARWGGTKVAGGREFEGKSGDRGREWVLDEKNIARGGEQGDCNGWKGRERGKWG